MAKGGSGKGSPFERDVCRALSLWWSGGRDDFIFWRSNSSGAHATQRAKKQLDTFGHSGDICAVNPAGQPLIDLIAFECKRGYNTATLADLLDKDPKPDKAGKAPKPQTYEEWFAKAQKSCENAGSFAWALIHKRDGKRLPVILVPDRLHAALKLCNVFVGYWEPTPGHREEIYGSTLGNFLAGVTPAQIRSLSESL